MVIRLICAVTLSLCSVTAAGDQVTRSVSLSEPVRAHLKNERFGIVTSVRGLPLGVRNELQQLFGSYSLDIAEPGAKFESDDVVRNPPLPIRRLVVAGCSIDHCLVYYERGGYSPSWRAAYFHWTPDATRLEAGGIAPRGLATIDAVRNAMLSGAVKAPTNLW